MKRVAKALCSLVAAVVIACLLTMPALADTPYTYKVRVLAGNEGTVNGKSIDEVSEIAAGTEITLSNLFDAQVTNAKYYVKGFRVSGQDNLDGLKDNIVVNEDMDFVVSYGVSGEMVSYTLNFVEQGSGRVLANPITRHGKKGDKPVAAYEYIEGYRPLYRNITGTLGEEGTNNWTFEYVPLATGETITTTVVTTVGGGTAAAVTTPVAGTAAGGAAAGGEAGGVVAGTEGGEGTATTTPVETAPPTQEILDVDNPLAGPNGQGTGTQGTGGTGTFSTVKGLPIPLIILIILILLAILFFLLFYKRRKSEEDKGTWK